MLSDVCKYNKPVKFEYELLKPDGFICIKEAVVNEENGEVISPAEYEQLYQSLGYISDYLDDSIKFDITTYDELNLSIPKYVIRQQKTIRNPIWDLIRGKYVIEISKSDSDERERFVIGKIEKNIDDKSIKNVPAYSLEHEYMDKHLRNYKSTSETDVEIEKVYDIKEILDNINTKYMNNTWSVGYVDSNVITRKRTYDFSDGSIYEFFNKLQEDFTCIFKFDTIKRKINVYDLTIYPVCPKCHKGDYLVFDTSTLECYNPDCYIEATDINSGLYSADSTITKEINGVETKVLAHNGNKVNWKTTLYGKDRGLYLTDKKYISKFTENDDTASIVTRLYVYGKDDLGIQSATDNITGQGYIEDMSYFRNDKYMTPELLNALDTYDKLVETHRGEWTEYIDKNFELLREYSKLTVVNDEEKDLLESLEYEIQIVRKLYSAEATGLSYEKLDELKKTLKDYEDKILYTIDEKGEKQPWKVIDLLEELSIQIKQDEKIVDISKAIQAVTDKFKAYSALQLHLDTDMDLSQYSLGQLQEALKVYNARIDTINEIQTNIVSADIDPELTTGTSWAEGDIISYRLIYEDNIDGLVYTDKGKTFSEISHKIVSSDINNGVVEIALPTLYTKEVRATANYILQVWLSKYNNEVAGKYEDRVLQTEDAQYRVVETGESGTGKSQYKLQQTNVDLYEVRDSLQQAIVLKQKEVDLKQKEIDANDKLIADLKTQLAFDTATDENGNLILTNELIMEYNGYIKEDVYSNTNIGVADITEDVGSTTYQDRINELYLDGLTEMYSVSTATVELNIDVINFYRDVRCQRDWDKLGLGDMIHIGHKDAINPDNIVRVTQISYSPNDSNISMTLSNEDKFKSGHELAEKFFSTTIATNSTVNVNSDKWNKAQSNAVDEILNNGWDAARSSIFSGEYVNLEINERGITVSGQIDNNNQMRLSNNLLTFTNDNWATTKTAIANGSIMAEYLIGRILVGQILNIIATKADGTTMTFRVDGDGVKIDNGNLTILPMDGDIKDKNGITLSPDPNEGFVCTSYNDNGVADFKIKINGQDGITMSTLDSKGNVKKTVFTVDTKGNLRSIGDIYANDLKLGGLNGQSVITYIDKATGKNTNYVIDDVVNSDGEVINDKVIAALQGKNISCAGLMIKSGDRSFTVGSDARVTINNGDFIMYDSNSNELSINPTDFIKWVINGEDKFYYDSNTDSIVFKGDIRASNLYGNKYYNENGTAYLEVGVSSGSNYGDLTIYNNKGNERFKIEDQLNGMNLKFKDNTFLYSTGTSTAMSGLWNYNKSEVATQDDIENLQSQINALKNTNSNPII